MRWLALALLAGLCACGSVGGTAGPGGTQTGGTPSPPSLSQADLQYRLVDTVGAPVFCDPFQYPVARPVDPADVARGVATLRSQDPAEFDAIVRHEHLDAGNLSAADDARILTQVSALATIRLTPAGAGYSFSYEVDGAQTADVTGTIDARGVVSVAGRTPAPRRPCPRCLAAWTRIGTPAGDVPVTSLHPGMLVWTLDATGRRVAAPVLLVESTIVPAGHEVVHLALRDGRSVDVSPGHPLPDGRPVGDVRPGDEMDGSIVASAGLRRYGAPATWDLLPAGTTHVYWADGIPLGSTLA